MVVTLQQILGWETLKKVLNKRKSNMTEQEWLTCTDPIKMLEVGSQLDWKVPSKRKQVLFACAILGPKYESDIEEFGYINHAMFDKRISVSFKRKGGITDEIITNKTPAQVADIMREIVGNPFRPVTLPFGPCKHCGQPMTARVHGAHVAGPCPWLTPTVLSLAQAAYQERPGKKCSRCRGAGKELSPVYDDGPISSTAAEVVGYSPIMNSPCRSAGCKQGRIDDGTLDPARLAVLSDALEEAGCPTDEECGQCPVLEKAKVTSAGYYDRDMVQEVIEHGKAKKRCRCGGTGRIPHPILSHLRSSGQHVRGCWALDLLLGKE